MALIFVDVEATGGSPATGLMTEFGAVEFQTRETFHGVLYDSEPDPAFPAKPVLIGHSEYDHKKIMQDFADWLKKVGDNHPVFVSDNPAYDYQWINYYFDKHLGHNPFGHSARRISDFYAGLKGSWRNTQEWKRYRVTPHTHMPVDDAMGNVEAFETFTKMHGIVIT